MFCNTSGSHHIINIHDYLSSIFVTISLNLCKSQMACSLKAENLYSQFFFHASYLKRFCHPIQTASHSFPNAQLNTIFCFKSMHFHFLYPAYCLFHCVQHRNLCFNSKLCPITTKVTSIGISSSQVIND